jgi:hypothetical protein
MNIYLGEDTQFLEKINELTKFKQVKMDKPVYQLYMHILNDAPEVLIVDFTTNFHKAYDILYMLRTLGKAESIKPIGVLSGESTKDERYACLYSGTRELIIKGSDVKTIISEMLNSKIELAKAIVNEESKVSIFARVSRINEDHFILESPFELTKAFELKSFLSKHGFRFFKTILGTIKSLHLSYPYSYKVKLDYNKKSDNISKSELKKIIDSKKSVPKVTHISILDTQSMLLASLKKNFFELPYKLDIQCQQETFLDRLDKSEIILINGASLYLGEKLNQDFIDKIINKISKITNKPFLLILNQKEELSINYKNMLISEKELTFENIDPLIERYEAAKDFSEYHYYQFQERDGLVSIKEPIELIEITESYFLFSTEQTLPEGTRLELLEKTKVFGTLVKGENLPKGKMKNTYKAAIHGYSEKDENDIRVLINEYIFKPKNKEQIKELEEFTEKNKQYLKDNGYE